MLDFLKKFTLSEDFAEPTLLNCKMNSVYYVTGWAIENTQDFNFIRRGYTVHDDVMGTVHVAIKKIHEHVIIASKKSLRDYKIHFSNPEHFNPEYHMFALWVDEDIFHNPQKILTELKDKYLLSE